MKVRVFSSSQKAQCCVAPITHCTTPRLLGLKSIYPKGHAPLAKWDWDFSWQTRFTFLPNRGHHSTWSAATQWRAKPPRSIESACFQRSSGRSVVGLNNRSKLTMLQTCRVSFPHSRIGPLGFGTNSHWVSRENVLHLFNRFWMLIRGRVRCWRWCYLADVCYSICYG